MCIYYIVESLQFQVHCGIEVLLQCGPAASEMLQSGLYKVQSISGEI